MTSSVCDIAQGTCVPCEGGITPLTAAEAQALLPQVPGWECADGGRAIRRRFRFRNFRQSLAFVNQVGEIAESEGHHPDITFGWGYADIRLTTHAIDGLHRNDFIIAAKINLLQPDVK